MKTKYSDIEQYVTKDGSTIRELMHPDMHVAAGIHSGVSSGLDADNGVKNQSLAEATVPVGVTTILHKHLLTEELYFITSGNGLMTLGEKQFDVAEGETICISPGTLHCIRNTGSHTLTILCCCSPAYSHDDTELLG